MTNVYIMPAAHNAPNASGNPAVPPFAPALITRSRGDGKPSAPAYLKQLERKGNSNLTDRFIARTMRIDDSVATSLAASLLRRPSCFMRTAISQPRPPPSATATRPHDAPGNLLPMLIRRDAPRPASPAGPGLRK